MSIFAKKKKKKKSSQQLPCTRTMHLLRAFNVEHQWTRKDSVELSTFYPLLPPKEQENIIFA